MCRALREFVDLIGLPDHAAAKVIGVSPASLCRILAGKYKPDSRTAYGIENFTAGMVTLWHMIHPDEPLSEPDPRQAQWARERFEADGTDEFEASTTTVVG